MEKLRGYAALANLKDDNNRILKDADNINEALFRFLVLAEIMKRDPCAKCQTEWRKYDLLVTSGQRSYVIEFKFRFLNREYDLKGHLSGGILDWNRPSPRHARTPAPCCLLVLIGLPVAATARPCFLLDPSPSQTCQTLTRRSCLAPGSPLYVADSRGHEGHLLGS